MSGTFWKDAGIGSSGSFTKGISDRALESVFSGSFLEHNPPKHNQSPLEMEVYFEKIIVQSIIFLGKVGQVKMTF